VPLDMPGEADDSEVRNVQQEIAQRASTPTAPATGREGN